MIAEKLLNRHRRNQLELVVRLAQRQIASRYKESAIGFLWSVLNPLILLIIYAVVFSQVFEAKFETEAGAKATFALALFSGLILFNLFAEIVNGSAYLVQSNAQLIKRTHVSPTVLPLATALAALMTFALNLVPFTVLYLLFEGLPPRTAVLLPVLVLLELVLTLGIAYIVAAAAAYVRDLQQIVPLYTTTILFLSPIFYPETAIPDHLRPWLNVLNPLFILLPASKDLLFWGRIPDLGPLAIYLVIGIVVLVIGFRFYRSAARGFGDVV